MRTSCTSPRERMAAISLTGSAVWVRVSPLEVMEVTTL